MKKIVMVVMVSLFFVGTASIAQATVISGSSGVATLSGLVLGALPATPDATVSYTFDLSDSQVLPALGTVTQNVYLNQTTEGVTGVLYTYKITRYPGVGSTLGVGRFSARNFSETSKVSTDYASNDAGNVDPVSVSRTSGGTFYFDWALADIIDDGDVSKMFFIQSDLPYYKVGNFSLLGDGTNDFVGFAPTATPEPGTVALFSTGLLGLLGFRRKRLV